MPNLTRKLLVISLLAPALSCHAEDLPNLSSEPLFLSSNVRSMMMLILGRDHTLANAAYNDAVSINGGSGITSSDTRFNPAYEYYGYFDPFKCYSYDKDKDKDKDNSKFRPDSNVASLASTDCGGKWSGNFLNYVTTSRMDALRKALYGGLRAIDSDSATTLELSYVPADGHSWAKSYDPYDPAQLIGTSHAFPINKFTPFSKDNKIFFGRVNLRGDSPTIPNLRVLNLTTIKNKGCSIYNQSGFSALSDSDYKNMRPRHWTGSGTPVTDIFLVKPSDTSICIIDFDGRANDYTGAVSDFTLKVDVCIDGKINNQNKEGCVKYPSGNYKPTGILQTYKDKADFGLITGSYDQHLSGGVLRRNIADFNSEIDKDTGVFKLAKSEGLGVGIVNALNKIKIAKFNMLKGNLDTTKNPWVLWGGNALTYDDCRLTNFNYVLNTSNSHCHDWGNPIGEMLAESMRYFYERAATPTKDFNLAKTVDNTLKLNQEKDWLDPFADTTLTNDKKARPYCTPAYNLIISNNNVNFDADNLPKIGNLSDWSGFADTIGTKESLNDKKFIIGTLLTDTNNTGAPTAKKLDKLSRVRGSTSEPTKQGSYASAGIAYWANLNNIHTGKTKPSRVRTMAIAMAAPIPDINIQMKDAKGNTRNITLVPTAKSVRKWQYMSEDNAFWDSATAGNSPIKYDSASTQPSNEIIGFSVDEISSTAGKFTVSFADVEQGEDNEADMTATYKYQVSGTTLTVTIISEYASGDIEQHAGYVLSGVSSSADGLYLDVRDIPSQGFGGYRSYGAEGDTLYYLDTPNTASNAVRGTSTTLLKPNFDGWYFRGSMNNWGKKYHSRMVPQGWGKFCTIQSFEDDKKDNNAFKISHMSNPDDQNELYPVNNWTLDKGVYKVCINASDKNISADWLAEVKDWGTVSALNMVISEADRTVTRTFTLGDASDTAFLKPPLWYAAKWGSFNSTPNDLATDNVTEPDLTKPDATPSGYYPVTAPGDLEKQLAKVFKDKLSSTSSTASAITTSSYRLSSDTIQFTSEFTQKSWSGDVVAKAISSSGTVGSTLWTAAELLDAKAYADRIIFSYDPSAEKVTLFDSPSTLTGDAGELTQAQINTLLADSGKSGETDANKLTFVQNLINYLRGDRSNEDTLFRKRTHVLGDIVHSTPMYGQSITDKRPFVIVGSNDGMVHVFDAHRTTATGGGSEIFAYVPSQTMRASSDANVPESLAAYAKSDYQTKHRYYVDGDISLATINNKRMAFGALGQGGRGIYALDLTDLSKVTTSSASAIVKWEYTHANMGFNQAAPAVVDVKLAAKTRVVIFSNGFNAPVLPEAGACGAYPCGTVFVLNAQTGKLLAALTTTAMSGLSEPAVVDKDGDGYADTIYAGDLKGNVWRFDISNAKPASWSGGTKIFTATASDGATGQPITSRPSVSKHASGGVMVYLGTGKYLETTDSIASNQTYKESLYGLWDNPQNTAEIKRNSLFARTITDNDTSRFIADSATAIDWSSQRGWYMDLPTTGERIVTNTEYVYGKLNVTTMIPGSDTVNCTNGGKGWLMQLDAATGKSYVSGSDADKATANQQTGGVPSNLNATLVSSGGKLTDTSTTQAHTLQQTSVTNPGAPVGPLTWKQIY